MTLQFIDGADVGDAAVKYSTTTGGPSGGVAPTSSTTTRYGFGRSFVVNGNPSQVTRKFPAASQIFVGFAFAHSNVSAGAGKFFFGLYGDNGTTNHLLLQWTATGLIGLYRGGGPTLLATSSFITDPIVASNIWHYLEISATINDTTGSVIIRSDGVQILSFTGDTKNGGTNSSTDEVAFATYAGTGAAVYYDDVYILDDTGSAPYNTFLGEVRVATLVPNGAGASTQWTPSAGTNFGAVDEIPYSAADSVSTFTSGNRDTYTLGDLPTTPATIYAVRSNVIAKKTDTGIPSIKVVDRSGGTNYYGPTIALGTADATALGTLRTVDPATSAVWTASGVNALEMGVELA